MKIFMLILSTLLFYIVTGCSDKNDQQPETSKEIIGTKKTVNFSGFYFVAKYNKHPAVYYYDAGTGSSNVFWYDKRDDVIELTYSPDGKTIFFITARDYGKKGALPFVNKSKLYRIDVIKRKAEFLKEIGTGIQIYTSWEPNNNFKLVINSVDPVIATYINQNSLLINSFGKTLKDEINIYDLTKEGYPRLPEPEIDIESPGGNFSFVRAQKDTSVVQLKDSDGKLIPLIKTFQNINKIYWSDSDTLLVFTTLDVSPENSSINTGEIETSNLVIYSSTDTSIIKKWKGDGLKRFLIIGNTLVFDDGFGNNSVIRIYDLSKRETINEIRVKGGCGLRNIPQVPL